MTLIEAGIHRPCSEAAALLDGLALQSLWPNVGQTRKLTRSIPLDEGSWLRVTCLNNFSKHCGSFRSRAVFILQRPASLSSPPYLECCGLETPYCCWLYRRGRSWGGRVHRWSTAAHSPEIINDCFERISMSDSCFETLPGAPNFSEISMR